MDSRSLNRIATVREPSTSRDELGQPSPTMTDVATIWVNIRHLSGLESIRSGQDTSVVVASIRAKRRTDLRPDMTVTERDSGRTYVVEAVLPDEVDRDHVDMTCHLLN